MLSLQHDAFQRSTTSNTRHAHHLPVATGEGGCWAHGSGEWEKENLGVQERGRINLPDLPCSWLSARLALCNQGLRAFRIRDTYGQGTVYLLYQEKKKGNGGQEGY
eukprot:1159660-Pelagomonas_calceolata.AAC.1